MREDKQGKSADAGRQQMQRAHAHQGNIQAAANVLPKQEADPASDYEEHQSARVSAHDDMKSQPKHGGDNAGEDDDGVGHGGCDSRLDW